MRHCVCVCGHRRPRDIEVCNHSETNTTRAIVFARQLCFQSGKRKNYRNIKGLRFGQVENVVNLSNDSLEFGVIKSAVLVVLHGDDDRRQGKNR